MDFLDQIISWDEDFIYWVNSFHSPILDTVMRFLSDKFASIPVYLLLLFTFYKKYSAKSFLVLTPIIGLLILLADQGASGFAKPYFERLRPCHAMDLYLADGCGGKFGFFSSHASNSFAVAVLFSLLVFKNNKASFLLILTWAVLVSFSRIYLGAHYASDVIVGAIYGSICALFCGILFSLLYKRLIKF